MRLLKHILVNNWVVLLYLVYKYLSSVIHASAESGYSGTYMLKIQHSVYLYYGDINHIVVLVLHEFTHR